MSLKPFHRFLNPLPAVPCREQLTTRITPSCLIPFYLWAKPGCLLFLSWKEEKGEAQKDDLDQKQENEATYENEQRDDDFGHALTFLRTWKMEPWPHA